MDVQFQSELGKERALFATFKNLRWWSFAVKVLLFSGQDKRRREYVARIHFLDSIPLLLRQLGRKKTRLHMFVIYGCVDSRLPFTFHMGSQWSRYWLLLVSHISSSSWWAAWIMKRLPKDDRKFGDRIFEDKEHLQMAGFHEGRMGASWLDWSKSDSSRYRSAINMITGSNSALRGHQWEWRTWKLW